MESDIVSLSIPRPVGVGGIMFGVDGACGDEGAMFSRWLWWFPVLSAQTSEVNSKGNEGVAKGEGDDVDPAVGDGASR